MRTTLRERLLSGFDVSNLTFPPPSSYVDGIFLQLWEALLIDIDAKCQLYSLALLRSYNTRAFSSTMGETFFFGTHTAG